MSGFWTTYIYGANKYIAPDKDSLVPLSALETVDPANDTKWTAIVIRGWEDIPAPAKDKTEYVDKTVSHAGVQYVDNVLKTRPYYFPEERYLVKRIEKALLKKYIYLYQGDYKFIDTEYPEKSFQPHPDGSALMVAGGITGEYDYDDGSISIDVTLRNVKPLYPED